MHFPFKAISLIIISIFLFQCNLKTDKESVFKPPIKNTGNNQLLIPATENGKTTYNNKCLKCHSIGNNLTNTTAPHLNNLIGRKLGSVKNYRYSKSFKKANQMNITWNRYNLLQFIKEPEKYIQKIMKNDKAHTRMTYKVREPEEIMQIINYISAPSNSKLKLKQSLNTSNTKCFAKPKPNIDFSGCNFSGVDFSGVDLTGANLKNTNFLGAKLNRTNLTRANLTGALLSGADLTETNFESANLTGATMIKAFLGKTIFKNTIFENVTWVNGQTCIPGSIGKCNY